MNDSEIFKLCSIFVGVELCDNFFLYDLFQCQVLSSAVQPYGEYIVVSLQLELTMSIPEAYQKIFKVQTVPVVQDTDFAEFEDKNEKEQKVPRFRLVELKVPPRVAYFEESAHNVDLKDCESRKNIVLCCV